MMRRKLVSSHQQCCELLDGSIPLPPLTLDCIQPIMMDFNGDDDEDFIKKVFDEIKFLLCHKIYATDFISPPMRNYLLEKGYYKIPLFLAFAEIYLEIKAEIH